MNWQDVLKLACKEARLELMHLGLVRYTWPDDDGDLAVSKIDLRNPALPAYVAELLVAKIVEHDPGNKRLHAFEAYLHRHARLSISTASAVIRIPAALVALGNLTPEQAQEME